MQVELELLQLLLDDPKMGVAQAAVALGITVRTLHNYCQKQLGMSPGRYIKLARLLHARMALLHADPACSSVNAVAIACGFTQPGRFSVDYRQAFGEMPSQTLRADLHRQRSDRGRDGGAASIDPRFKAPRPASINAASGALVSRHVVPPVRDAQVCDTPVNFRSHIRSNSIGSES